MTNRSLLAVLAVSLVALGVFLFTATRTDAPIVPRAAPLARAATPAKATPAPLPVPVESVKKLEAVEEQRPSTRALARSAYEDELAEGHWIEGRVVFPEGTPLDEECFVVADGRSFEHGDEHRARVASDGRFRVAFSKRTKKGRVRLDAKYLYLDESPRIEVSDATDVTLEPLLGGRIAGRFVPEEGEESEGIDVNVWAHGDGVNASVAVHTLEFELNGLAPDRSYFVGFQSEVHESDQQENLSVRAGETSTVEFALVVGATVDGVVVDASGAPVGGASISTTEGTFTADGLTQTDADGRFRLAGLARDSISIGVRHPAFCLAHRDVPELVDQRDVTGLRIVLARGKSIHGRVVFPDGTPAGGATVEYDHPDFADEPWKDAITVKAEDDGTFVLAGLGDEPIDLRAVAVEKTKVEVISEVTGKARQKTQRTTHRGVAEHVVPGAAGVVVQLGSGHSLVGLVVDASGTPIPDFRVEVDEADEVANFISLDSIVSRRFRESDGAFRIEGLASGSFDVNVTATGFGDAQSQRRTLPRDTEPLRFELQRSASVAGIVIAPNGAPLANARVEESDSGFGMRRWTGEDELSEADGAFLLEDLNSGTVALIAHADGYASNEPVVLSLVPGEERRGVELRLKSGVTVTGVVLGVGGRPDPHREVRFQSRGSRDVRTTTSDANGAFQFDGVPPGDSTIDVASTPSDARALLGPDATPFDVHLLRRSAHVDTSDSAAAHVVLTFRELDFVTVRGRVLVGGAPPVSGAWVNSADHSEEGFGQLATTRTDSDGNYRITLPCPGEYTFSVQDTNTSFETSATIPNVTEFALDLVFDIGSIEGTVRDTHGAPLEGMLVQAMSLESDMGAWSSALTDADGRYVAGPLVPGTYEVSVESPQQTEGHGFAGESRTGVLVTAGATARGVDFELTTGGSVRGRVRVDGKSVADAQVALFDAHGEHVTTALTDASGRFEIGAIRPGDAILFAWNQSRLTSRPLPVAIRGGETTEGDLDLFEAGSLVVALVGPSGALLAGDVAIDGPLREFTFFIEQEGTWVAEKVPPGEYPLRATVDGIERTSSAHVAPGERTRVEIRFD